MAPTASSDAKLSILELDGLLDDTHLLIGGIAVQQYSPTRLSKDIDLVIDQASISGAIERLFPSLDYDNVDANEDDMRPAYVIVSRSDQGRVYFIGPKIQERPAYRYVNWDYLKQEGVPFSYQGKKCAHIVVPNVEKLAFLKLLAFINRIHAKTEKGQKDLSDFVNLSNHRSFRINYFYDVLRHTGCIEYVAGRISELKTQNAIALSPLQKSALFEVLNILYATPSGMGEGEASYSRIYTTEESNEFYEEIAYHYDVRNTELRYKAHQKTVGIVRRLVETCKHKVFVADLGCGTGKIIASSFVHDRRISWAGVDYSSAMLEQFERNLEESAIESRAILCDLRDEVYREDVQEELERADVILICFALTTIANTNVISKIMDSMKGGSTFVVSDIHPMYTLHRPYYDFHMSDGRRVCLRPSPVFPDLIEKMALQKGFSRIDHDIIYNRDGIPYSFVTQLLKGNSE
jgi:SAM-dependent methyltransferase